MGNSRRVLFVIGSAVLVVVASVMAWRGAESEGDLRANLRMSTPHEARSGAGSAGPQGDGGVNASPVLGNAHDGLIEVYVGRRGRILRTTSGDDEQRQRRVVAPLPIVIGPTLGDCGSRAMELAVIESGCPNPLVEIGDTLDGTMGAVFSWPEAVEMEEQAGGTLAYDDLWQSSGNAERRAAIRRRSAPLLRSFAGVNTRAQKLKAIDHPDELFAGEGHPGQCWSFKGARNLHRLPVLDDLFSTSGWTLLHLIRDVRDMALAGNVGHLRRFAHVLVQNTNFERAVAESADGAPLEAKQPRIGMCKKALCSVGDTEDRDAWWDHMSAAAAGRVSPRPVVPKTVPRGEVCFDHVTRQVQLWSALAEMSRDWAANRLERAEAGSAAPFGYVVAHIEAIATGSLRTFEAVEDPDAVRKARATMSTTFGKTSIEFSRDVNADLLEWLASGTPGDPDKQNRRWTAGTDWRKWQSARESQDHDASEASGLDNDDQEGSGTEQSGSEGGPSSDDGRSVQNVQLGGTLSGHAFVASDHYGKWRNCSPKFIEYVESLAHSTMRKFGYTPVYYGV